MLSFVVFVNSWIVVSFNLLWFCVWVRGEGCICFWVWFFSSFLLAFVYLCICARVCVCECMCLCVRCLVAVFVWVTMTYGAFVILKQTEYFFKKYKKVKQIKKSKWGGNNCMSCVLDLYSCVAHKTFKKYSWCKTPSYRKWQTLSYTDLSVYTVTSQNCVYKRLRKSKSTRTHARTQEQWEVEEADLFALGASLTRQCDRVSVLHCCIT